MYLKSLKGCRLKIGLYPYFDYDARGGGGEGSLVQSDKDNILQVNFAPEKFSIPSLTSRTTKFASLPLPPGIKIEMTMDKLRGTIEKNSGQIVLRFESRFCFSLGSIIKFPDLLVNTSLQTGRVKGKLNEEQGYALQKDGKTKLVGISTILPTNNKILDSFLNLPNEALAVLQCEIKLTEEENFNL